MYISQDTINEIKNLEDIRKRQGVPLPSLDISSTVTNRFLELYKRDINFNNQNDLDQLSNLHAQYSLMSKNSNLEFLSKSNTQDLKNFFNQYNQYDYSFLEKAYKIAYEFASDGVQKLGEEMEMANIFSDKLIRDDVINIIEKRKDANEILFYIYQTVAKEYFPEDAYDRTGKKIFGDMYTTIRNVEQYTQKDSSQNTANQKINYEEMSKKIDELNDLLRKKDEAEKKYLEDVKNAKSLELQRQSFIMMIEATKTLGSELEKAGQWSGSRNLMKVGAIIGSFGTIGYAAAQIGGFVKGIEQVSGFGMVFPAGAAIAAAISIFSILDSDDDNSIGEALEQIMGAINTLRKEMHEQFYQVHEEIFQVYEFLYYHHHDMVMRLDSLESLTKYSLIELSSLIKLDLYSDLLRITNNIHSKVLPRDADQFRHDLNILDSFALIISKDQSLNGANLNPNLILDAENQLNLRLNPMDNIAFFVKYAKEVLNIDALPNGYEVPNFDIYYVSAKAFLEMVIQAVNQDLSAKSPKDKLIDQKNADYIHKILARLESENTKIKNTMVIFDNNEVVHKAINVYEQEINALSDFIDKSMLEYSDKLNNKAFDCKDYLLKEGDIKSTNDVPIFAPVCYSVFSPNYFKVYYNSMHCNYKLYKGYPYGHCNIQISFPLFNGKVFYSPRLDDFMSFKNAGLTQYIFDDLPSANEKDIFNPNDQVYCANFRTPWGPLVKYRGIITHHSRHVEIQYADSDPFLDLSNRNNIKDLKSKKVIDSMTASVETKLVEYRKNFFDNLFDPAKFGTKYQEHLNKIRIYEKMINSYAQIIGEPLEIHFAQDIDKHVMNLQKFKAYEVIPSLDKYAPIIDISFDMSNLYDRWAWSESRYKRSANFFDEMIKVVKNLVSTLEQIEKETFENSEQRTTDENAKEQTQNAEKQQEKQNPKEIDNNNKDSEKIKIGEAYLDLKSLFQEILDHSDEIKELFSNKPQINEKFDKLLDNVNIEETFAINPVPEGLTLEQLITHQCEVHCLNRYVKYYSDSYRAFMENDQRMENVIGVIKELNDEIAPSCYC